MGSDIRTSISKRNPWYISKERYLELYHFCRQYKEWKEAYIELEEKEISCTSFLCVKNDFEISDPAGNTAVEMAILKSNMELVETVANGTDEVLGKYIFKAVTEGLAFTKLKTMYEIPCERDMYYDRYRKFFWLLNNAQNSHAPL